MRWRSPCTDDCVSSRPPLRKLMPARPDRPPMHEVGAPTRRVGRFRPAGARGPGAQVGSAIFKRWHGFPHYRSGECWHLSATGVLTTAASDGAMQRAIRSVVHRVRLRRIACTRNTDATSWRLYWRSGRLRAGALASTPGGRYSRPSRKDNPLAARLPTGGFVCRQRRC
jgi:hypothetical protein